MPNGERDDTAAREQGSPEETSPGPESDALPDDLPYDLVYVRARPWSDGQPRTASLVQLDFEFLGESLPIVIARERRQTLDHHGVSVLIVPQRYRDPAIGLDDAGARSEEALREARAENPDLGLGMPRLYGDHPMYYTFLAVSAQMERAGDTFPPGLLVSIDKCDGHVWSEAELSEFVALVAARQTAG